MIGEDRRDGVSMALPRAGEDTNVLDTKYRVCVVWMEDLS